MENTKSWDKNYNLSEVFRWHSGVAGSCWNKTLMKDFQLWTDFVFPILRIWLSLRYVVGRRRQAYLRYMVNAWYLTPAADVYVNMVLWIFANVTYSMQNLTLNFKMYFSFQHLTCILIWNLNNLRRSNLFYKHIKLSIILLFLLLKCNQLYDYPVANYMLKKITIKKNAMERVVNVYKCQNIRKRSFIT